MQDAFDPGAWHDFFVMVGGSAAVLTGLIFVAVSLHLHAIVKDPWRRGSAGSSLLAQMSVLLLAGVLLVPPQPAVALGAEIAVISIVNPAFSVMGLRRLSKAHGSHLLLELLLGIAVAVLAVGAGLSVAADVGPGLWLLLPGAAVALVTAVYNAWRLMIDIGEGPAIAG